MIFEVNDPEAAEFGVLPAPVWCASICDILIVWEYLLQAGIDNKQ